MNEKCFLIASSVRRIAIDQAPAQELTTTQTSMDMFLCEDMKELKKKKNKIMAVMFNSIIRKWPKWFQFLIFSSVFYFIHMVLICISNSMYDYIYILKGYIHNST